MNDSSSPNLIYYVYDGQTFTFPRIEGFESSKIEATKIELYSPKWSDGTTLFDCNTTSPEVKSNITYTFQKVLSKQFTSFTIGNENSSVTLSTNSGYSMIQNTTALEEITSFTSSSNGVNIFVQVGSNVTCSFTYNGNRYNGYSITKDGAQVTKDTNGGKSYTISNISLSSYNVTASSGNRNGVCIYSESEVLMSDGTTKKVRDINIGDLVSTWSFEEGRFVSRPVIFLEKLKNQFTIEIKIYFDDGTSVRVAGGQSYFDIDRLEYFSINEENALNYIGTNVMTYDNGKVSQKKIINCETKLVIEDTYEIITAYDFSFIYDNVLSMEPFLLYKLPFEINENLQYDKEQMRADIEKYGLYTYEEWSMYASEELFNLLNGKYFKVAIEKGNFTMEYLLEIIEKYLNEDNLT